jgi:hypothetical protein
MDTGSTIYQLTGTAALMCTHLPLPAENGFAMFLDKWQTLIGAAVGGLMGVVGALLVAARATRRERRIASSAVLPELMQLRAAHMHLEKYVGKEKCIKLMWRRPKILTLRSPAITQLSDVDARLYSHLFQCQMTHEGFEERLEQFGRDENDARAPMPNANKVMAEERVQRSVASVIDAWGYAVEHATLAEYFLDRLIFNRWPAWLMRIRMRFCPNDLDRRSKHLLGTGEILGMNQQASADSSPSLDENTLI